MVIKIELSGHHPEDSILRLDTLFPASTYASLLFLSFILVKPVFQQLSKKGLVESESFEILHVCTCFPPTLILDE